MSSYALYDMDGNQVPQQLVMEVGKIFEGILKEAKLHILLLFNYFSHFDFNTL